MNVMLTLLTRTQLKGNHRVLGMVKQEFLQWRADVESGKLVPPDDDPYWEGVRLAKRWAPLMPLIADRLSAKEDKIFMSAIDNG